MMLSNSWWRLRKAAIRSRRETVMVKKRGKNCRDLINSHSHPIAVDSVSLPISPIHTLPPFTSHLSSPFSLHTTSSVEHRGGDLPLHFLSLRWLSDTTGLLPLHSSPPDFVDSLQTSQEKHRLSSVVLIALAVPYPRIDVSTGSGLRPPATTTTIDYIDTPLQLHGFANPESKKYFCQQQPICQAVAIPSEPDSNSKRLLRIRKPLCSSGHNRFKLDSSPKRNFPRDYHCNTTDRTGFSRRSTTVLPFAPSL